MAGLANSRRPAAPMRAPAVPAIRLRHLRWSVPAALFLVVVGYELGPSLWLQARFGHTYHLLAEILVYGTVGPVIAFVLLTFLGRWLEERETTDLQSRLLAQARAELAESRQMADRALQELFAASLRLSVLEASLPPETAEELQAARTALDEAVRQVRADLLKPPGGE